LKKTIDFFKEELKTMDQCSHEVRTDYWKGIIQACRQRSTGQSAKSWLDENGISEQSYYHWQRKFRQQTYDFVKESTAVAPIIPAATDISFVELPCAPSEQVNTQDIDSPHVAVIRTSAMTIEITNAISETVLTRILRGISNA
jgi:putative transposase